MHSSSLFAGIALAATASASSLASLCTASYAKSILPTGVFGADIEVNFDSVTAAATYNYTTPSSVFYPESTYDFCNITFSYTHTGRNDTVLLSYWLPTPEKFGGRYLATGGGAYAINSGSDSVAGGVAYGAVSGYTDGGFGSFDTDFDAVFPTANGTANWDATYMFGYQAIYEQTLVGQHIASSFYNSSAKVYTYYQGCSEGGREGWSQVQRFGETFDGAMIGAPALRYAMQQVNHIYSLQAERDVGYYPPPCELQKIVNATVAACDPLDGYTDGVVARSDLCKLHFNINSTIGLAYSCDATAAVSLGPITEAAQPAQNGTVTAKGVAVAQAILDGLHDSEGRRAYLSFQPGLVSFADAATTYDTDTDTWVLDSDSSGGEWIPRFLDLQDTDVISDWTNITDDTLRNWMLQGLQTYGDSLQTTWPDLTPFKKNGGKVIHYHGESDNSIPPASSIHYRESVRKIMYPHKSFKESNEELSEWYKFYLVPGAAHCATNEYQPNGPFPNLNFPVMIDWVEKGIEPKGLNATHLAGDNEGESAKICEWPLRPIWKDNSTSMSCEYDQESINTWFYEFPSFPMPIY